ncbi:hypothetical protein CTAYLR_007312 [Chrysophaeum taylorii]|uniref:PH domain-containing protein n=1 Tax=Chrysophaeum taylorii TaxID=2483200 RepID=A0AAD7U778_9STRA|nr:hypothetical protein CTAYLR_007312 [Chrysophaeum taylorii]
MNIVVEHDECFSRTLKDEFGRPLRTRGEMLKKGGSRNVRASLSGRRNWQERYFSLDIDRGELRYFEDASMGAQKGLVQLTAETQIQRSAPNLKGKHGRGVEEQELHYFELTACKDDRGVLREGPFQVRARSAQELEEWQASIDFSLQLVRAAANQVAVDDLKPNAPLVAELAETLKRRSDSLAPPPCDSSKMIDTLP